MMFMKVICIFLLESFLILTLAFINFYIEPQFGYLEPKLLKKILEIPTIYNAGTIFNLDVSYGINKHVHNLNFIKFIKL